MGRSLYVSETWPRPNTGSVHMHNESLFENPRLLYRRSKAIVGCLHLARPISNWPYSSHQQPCHVSCAAAEATSPELADGLASYLENTPEYSDFWAVFLNINNTTDTGFPILPVLLALSLQLLLLRTDLAQHASCCRDSSPRRLCPAQDLQHACT